MERMLHSEARNDAASPSWHGHEPPGRDHAAVVSALTVRHWALLGADKSAKRSVPAVENTPHQPATPPLRHDPAKHAERLRIAASMYAIGKSAWPALHVPLDVFSRFVITRPLSIRRLQQLPAGRASDLFLVCATSHGESAAVRAFDTVYVQNLHRVVRTQCAFLRSCDHDEMKQLVRERLLIRNEPCPPRISEYSGAGALRSWVATVAIRLARSMARAHKEVLVGDPDPEVICGTEDPESELIGCECQAEVADALRLARKRLGEHGWELLRRRYDEDLSAARIGVLCGVHRATVARWLESAHGMVDLELRRHLAARHQQGHREVDAVIQCAMRRHEWSQKPVLATAG